MARKKTKPKTVEDAIEAAAEEFVPIKREPRWPEEAPILDANDICRTVDISTKDGVKLGLNAWLDRAFLYDNMPSTDERDEAYTALLGVLRERTGRDLAVWEYNDDKQFDLEFLAACWNEMLNRTGYDIDKKLRVDDGSHIQRKRGRQ